MEETRGGWWGGIIRVIGGRGNFEITSKNYAQRKIGAHNLFHKLLIAANTICHACNCGDPQLDKVLVHKERHVAAD